MFPLVPRSLRGRDRLEFEMLEVNCIDQTALPKEEGSI